MALSNQKEGNSTVSEPKPKPPPRMTVTYHGEPSGAVIAAALIEIVGKQPKTQQPAA